MNLLARLEQEQSLVFGHRGARAYAPMNTLPAFELAYQQGAVGVELDVHLSKDKQPMLVHDFTVDATTNGSGRVADLTLAELKGLDAGGWFDQAFAGTRIPTLDEVFTALGHKLYFNVEIKAESAESTGVEEVVAAAITRFSLQGRVLVSSFEPMVLKRFRALLPEVPLGFLFMEPLAAAETLAEFPYEALHPHYSLIDAALMHVCKAKALWVTTWTVNDPAEALRLRDLGVNIIVTDQPDLIIQALR